jgi:hypothetical protein
LRNKNKFELEVDKKLYSTMDQSEFREFGKAAIDFVADYLENIRERYISL